MKKLLIAQLLMVLVVSFKAEAQNSIFAGNDTSICSSGTATLTATVIPQASIVFDPDTDCYTNGIPIQGMAVDDTYSSPIPIGFDFCYLGNTYTDLIVSTNNYVTFDLTYTGFSPWQTQTLPDNTAPLNAIMGPWQDINPALGGQILYQVYGTAPYRHLTISWYQIPMYSCTGILYTSQLKLFETTGIIESHILDRQICSTWPTANPGTAVHGLHNFDGTFADIVPGRNNTAWAVNSEGFRWTPQGINPVVEWYDMAGNLLSTGLTFNVSPTDTTSYICKLTNGSGTICGSVESDTVTVNIIEPGNADFTYPASTYCQTGGQNPMPVLAPGSLGNFTSSPTGIIFVSTTTGEINLAGSAVGTYTISRIDASGICSDTAEFTLTITNNPDASLSYASAPYCATAIDATPVFSPGASAGTFSSSPAGLVFSNSNTGLVDLVASAAGTYTITNTINAFGCALTIDSTLITISDQTIDAGTSVQVCQGSPIALDGSVNGPNTGVSWTESTGNGIFGTPSDTVSNYTPNDINFVGSVILTLSTVGTVTCPSISDTLTLTITQGASVLPGTDFNICGITNAAQLNGSFGGLATSATWSGGAGTFSPSNTDPFATYLPTTAEEAAGSVTLVLTTDDPAGACPAVSDSMVITISQVPTVTASATQQNVCFGQSINLTGTATGSFTSSNWAAINGTGTFGSATSLNTTYTMSAADTSTGTLNFALIINSTAPCPLVQSNVSVTILPAPTATVSGGGVIGAGNTVCPAGASVPVIITLTGTPNWTIGYSINGINNTITGVTTQPYVFNDNTPGTFTLTSLSDASSCPGIMSGTAIVDTVGINGLVLTSPETCGDTDGVAGMLNVSGGNLPYTYTWNSNAASPIDSIAGLAAGTYNVIVTEANGCSETFPFVIQQILGVNAGFTADPMIGPVPMTVNFTNGSSGALTYLWDFGDTTTSTEMNPTHDFDHVGVYNVILSAYNTPGCVTTDTLQIVVEENFKYTEINVFTPNGDGINDKFTFDPKGVKKIYVEIFNRWGLRVAVIKDPLVGWDGENAPAGQYFYTFEIISLEGKTETGNGSFSLIK